MAARHRRAGLGRATPPTCCRSPIRRCIASGRAFAQLHRSRERPDPFRRDHALGAGRRGRRRALPGAIRLAAPPAAASLWLEDTGRWFAGPDGKPARAHGVVRVINERHDREQRLAYLSHFDELTGEMNRWQLTEVLEATLEEATRDRSSCGFLLVAVDNLARINEAYGFDDRRRGDRRRRQAHALADARQGSPRALSPATSSASILKNCTPDDMTVAADRLLAGVRDDVVHDRGRAGCRHRDDRRRHRAAPRPRRARDRWRARRRRSTPPRRSGAARSMAYRPNLEREAPRRENVRATDEIVDALNERRIFLAYEPVVAIGSRAAGILRMPDARAAGRTAACWRWATSCRWPSGSAWCG